MDAMLCVVQDGMVASGSVDTSVQLWLVRTLVHPCALVPPCASVAPCHVCRCLPAVCPMCMLHDPLCNTCSIQVQGDYPPSRSRCSIAAGQRGVQCLAEVPPVAVSSMPSSGSSVWARHFVLCVLCSDYLLFMLQ